MRNMPQPRPQRPTYPARTDSVPGLIRGVVVGMQPRIESQGRGVVTIWDFRLERHDAAGNPMPRVQVEMRGYSFLGSINNGDWVEIKGNWQRGEIVKPRQVYNLSTAAMVKSKDYSVIVKILITVFIIVWLMIVITIFANVISFPRGFP